MEKASHGRAPQVLTKEKKKQVKDELDRLKQAEKKKRRLEKALATSAAIRSELEKKKQKKKEQDRLDEEGAAIAEAVALHVLLGEDADASCQVMLKNTKRFDSLYHSSNTGLFLGYQSIANYPAEGPGWLSASYSPWCTWSYLGSGRSLSPAVHVKDLQLPYYENTGQGADISAGFIAEQAVSSLQIAENSPKDSISG
ncbi:uncharacterized protein LOC103721630 [Phoenix dactylifera]|uniref:Uncharacterized protein LOC103721630 n=1 Tax=Phoenix dactylifera TaxID=42345 RepID=A0A8B7D0E6_PHODC|nr:uncharacterized protein LOC103721630 [Phoenix dactylifera]